MTSRADRTVFPAVIALSLALFACADTGRDDAAAKSAATEQPPALEVSMPRPAAQAQAEQIIANGRLTEDERNTIEVVRKTKNSVVFITNLQYLRDFFFTSDELVPQGSGSGFVWDDRGHIVTNFHVIAEGVKYMVSLPDQRQVEATLVGRDPKKDIAVLKLGEPVPGLAPVTIGTSRSVRERAACASP